MNKIKEILISKLFPHPKNPRQDLGDLTELTESIKAVGIAQPPTVVKTNEMDTYTIIMGHRRVAAAKLAGIEKITCIVAELTRQQQLEMMLMENIQRSNLTILEEADGFQMCLDLGVSVKDLAKNTGISETTIRRKTSILKNDREKLEASVLRGGTLNDYLKLELIKDPEKRKEVLDKIGTNNFNYEVERALSTEKERETINEIEKTLLTFATKVTREECSGNRYVTRYNGYSKKEFPVPEDYETAEYIFHRAPESQYSTGYIELYKKAANIEIEEDEDGDPVQDAADEFIDNMIEELENRETIMHNLRRDFVLDISPQKIRENIDEVIRFVLRADFYKRSDTDKFSTLTGIKMEDGWPRRPERNSLEAKIKDHPEKYMLLNAYCKYEEYSFEHWDRSGELPFYITSCTCKSCDEIYEFLKTLGYEMSTKELEMIDGTIIDNYREEFYKKFPSLKEDE